MSIPGDFLKNAVHTETKTRQEADKQAEQLIKLPSKPSKTEDKAKDKASVYIQQILKKMPQMREDWEQQIAQRQRDRAYAEFRNIQGIDIITQDKQNFEALKQRLRACEAPLPEAMRQFLLPKLEAASAIATKNAALSKRTKQPVEIDLVTLGISQILTPEEKTQFKNLVLACRWVLKHATSQYAVIQKNGNELLSLGERKRRGQTVQNGNTMETGGNADNVFFTMGPGSDLATSNFLNYAETVITAEYEALMEKTPWSLTGLWSSGHVFAFALEEDSDPINICGTECQVKYRKVPANASMTDPSISSMTEPAEKTSFGLENKMQAEREATTSEREEITSESETKIISETEAITSEPDATSSESVEDQYQKTCTFKHRDGTVVTQTLTLTDDIFMHPRIDIAVALLTIEKIRLMGRETWEELMQADVALLQEVVQILFHSGIFEVHKPARFDIAPPVEVVTRTKPASGTIATIEERAILEPVMEAALLGDIETVLKALKQDNFPINQKITYSNNCCYTLTLLGAAILGGNPRIVEAILDCGPEHPGICTIEIHRKSTKMSDPVSLPVSFENVFEGVDVGPVFLSMVLSNPKVTTRILNNILQEKMPEDRKINSEAAFTILSILLKQGSRFRPGSRITRPFAFLESDVDLLFRFARPDPALVLELFKLRPMKCEDFALPLAVLSRSGAVLDRMISLGADVNAPYDPSEHRYRSELLDLTQGETPLITAVRLNEADLVKHLLKHNADINKPWSRASDYPIKVSDEEGLTPLMLAVKLGHKPLVEWLLQAGANPYLLNAMGDTAHSIAKAAQHTEILELLEAFIAADKNNSVSLQPISLQNAQNALQNASITLEASACKMHLHTTEIWFTGITEDNQRFFIIGNQEKEDAEDILSPFPSSPDTSSDFKFWVQMLRTWFNLTLDPKDTRWRNFGKFGVGIGGSANYYYSADLWTFEMGKKDSLQLLKMLPLFGNYSIITEAELLKAFSEKKAFNCQDAHISLPAAECLTLILKRWEAGKFQNEDIKKLKKLTEEFFIRQFDLLEAARKGDVATIQDLCSNHSARAQFYTPTLRALPYKPKEHPYDANLESPLLAAMEANQRNAIEVLMNFGAALPLESNGEREFAPSVIKTDSLALFQQFLALSSIQQAIQINPGTLDAFRAPATQYDSPNILTHLMAELPKDKHEETLLMAASYLSHACLEKMGDLSDQKQLQITIPHCFNAYVTPNIFSAGRFQAEQDNRVVKCLTILFKELEKKFQDGTTGAQPIIIPNRNNPALLTLLRDEAHKPYFKKCFFATHYDEKDKKTLPWLDFDFSKLDSNVDSQMMSASFASTSSTAPTLNVSPAAHSATASILSLESSSSPAPIPVPMPILPRFNTSLATAMSEENVGLGTPTPSQPQQRKG